MVIEDGDAAELAHALGIAAKARGMSEIAQASGLTRDALYKAFKPNARPRFDTINRVCVPPLVFAWWPNLLTSLNFLLNSPLLNV